MNPTPRLDRRELLAGGAAALLAGLAGCSDDPEPGTRDPVSNVPASASVLLDADAALVDHEGTRRLLAAIAGGDEGLVASFEAKTGLEADGAERVLLFSEAPGSRKRAVVVEGAWEEATVVDAIESAQGTAFEATDYEGGTVYESSGGTNPNSTDSTNGTNSTNGENGASSTNTTDSDTTTSGEGRDLLTVESLGVVAEGRYVFGDGGSVRAAIETAYGATDAVGGGLLDALESADVESDGTTYVTAATDAPRAYLPADDEVRLPPGVSLDLFEKAETANAAYAAEGSQVALEANLHAVDEDAATRLADFTVSGLVFLRNGVDEAIAAELEKVTVEEDGTVVTITYRSDVEGAVTLVEWVT